MFLYAFILMQHHSTQNQFDPVVWGSSFWFILHTITFHYPIVATSSVKKQYYDFIQKLPVLLPNDKIGNEFKTLLDEYPVSPYLDGQDSFVRWAHFIHNRVNDKQKKPQMSFDDFMGLYRSSLYEPTKKQKKRQKIQQYIVYGSLVSACMIIIYVGISRDHLT